MPRSDVHHFPVRSIGFSVTHDINKFIRTSMISTVFGSSRILPLNSPTWHSDYVSDMLKPSILIDINSIHTPNAVYATLLLCSFDQPLGLSPVLFCENDLVLAFPNRFNRQGSFSLTFTPSFVTSFERSRRYTLARLTSEISYKGHKERFCSPHDPAHFCVIHRITGLFVMTV